MTVDDLKGEKSHLVDFWITDSACQLINGEIAFSQYFKTGNGGLILRSALEDSHPESPKGLLKRADYLIAANQQ